jgi:hypothetical protein
MRGLNEPVQNVMTPFILLRNTQRDTIENFQQLIFDSQFITLNSFTYLLPLLWS